jgi:VanZ family protein
MIPSNIYKGLFWGAIFAVLILSLLPLSVPALDLFPWQDKVHHFIVYGVLCFLAIKTYGESRSIWTIGLSLVVFGLGLEIVQSVTGYRFGDPLDLLANTLGVVAVAILHFAQKRML